MPPKYRAARVGGVLSATVEIRSDGAQVLRSTEALAPNPASLNERLAHWAAQAPDRVFAAQRDRSGAWRTLTYAQMLQRVRAVGQALAQRGLSAERPVAILSGNDLEHLTLALGAMWAGIAYAPTGVLFIAVYVIATIVSALEAEVPAGPAVHDHPVKHVVAMLAARLIVPK